MISNSLQIKDTQYGKGVFAKKSIPKDQLILSFSGNLYYEEEIPDTASEHYLQVGLDSYMGPSGMEDDYVNHSCNPNSGLYDLSRFYSDTKTNSKIWLVALKNIEINEEITFDYSTSIDSDWTMECKCKSSNCRGRIGSFKDLPKDLQAYYLDLDIVMSYLHDTRRME